MKLINQPRAYGLISILLHWGMGLLIFGLFALGLWMTSLDYYHSWYVQAPWIHKSVGVIVGALLVFRWFWRLGNTKPVAAPNLHPIEKILAHLMHLTLYLVMAVVIISGYLITTANEQAISVFDWFEIPAITTTINSQEDIAGEVHYYLSFLLIGLSCLHGLAAIKHHVIDKNDTLRNMTFPKHKDRK